MEIPPLLFVLAILVVLAVGIAVGYFLGVARTRITSAEARVEMAEVRARSERLEEENNGLIERASRDQNLLQALAPITTKLADMTTKVQQMERHQVSATARLGEQLTNSSQASKELLNVTTSLRSALTSTSSRGVWGEAELERIVTAAGMLPHVHFDTQTAIGGQRPDMLIYLPGDGTIAVDAKVPLSAYLKAAELTNDVNRAEERSQLLNEHAKAVRSHILELAKRNYPSQFPGSPQLTIMFLPAESLLSEAVQANPALLDEAAKLGVALTSPSSLLALLRAVASTWSTSRVTEEAGEVLALGKDLVQRLGDLSKHLTNVGTHLSRTVKAYNQSIGTLENRLLVTARNFDSLPSDNLEVPQLSNEATQIRSISRAELLDEASGS
ncbi:DNA recombination protein RmuC [Flaviflexus massiliensis]|uniref:DNA recombination protein RmuC n=1 Tax=Flaviflexus massiliensis TaxID=1522309 RepID=UPI0006D596EE|nr:DNA recombination protein RmuC [Flaviflexus massiliensis]